MDLKFVDVARQGATTLVALILLFSLCVFGMFGCSSAGQVAASLYGENIYEEDINDYVADYRDKMGYSDDDAWKSYLEENEMTAADVRSKTIDEYAVKIVVQHYADEMGATADEDAVDQRIQQFRASMMATDDDTWASVLEQYGTDEETLRERYRYEDLRDQVYAQYVEPADPSDEELADYAKSEMKGTETKHFVYFKGADYTTMQATLRKLQNADDTAAAVEALAADPGDDTSYVDFGWDLGATADTQVMETVANLKKGEVCDALVADGENYQIIYIVDSYTFPKKGDVEVASMPDGLLDTLRQAYADGVWSTLCGQWMREQIDENITINDAPESVPYDVVGE